MTETELRKAEAATPDIVAMLRSPANVFYEYAADNGDMLTKAADEITALRAKVKAQAEAFVAFMVSPATQTFIGEFKKAEYGESLFFPDAGKTVEQLGG